MAYSSSSSLSELIAFLKPKPGGRNAVEAIKRRTLFGIKDPMVSRIYELSGEIDKSGSILDVGCYGGWLYHHLGKPAGYIGLDNWPEAIEAAKELAPEARFVCRDLLDFNEPVDFLWSTQIFWGERVGEAMEHMKKLGKHGLAALVRAEAKSIGEHEERSSFGIFRW